jgi:hypothetical protein
MSAVRRAARRSRHVAPMRESDEVVANDDAVPIR